MTLSIIYTRVMQGFINSFKPLFTAYKGEMVLLSSALAICLISIALFFQQRDNHVNVSPQSIKRETRTYDQKQDITVDISGAVKHPFVYRFPHTTRIIDVLQKAGGLVPDADEAFVRRSINLARIVSDQEKIYIPYISDTSEGFVIENKRMLDYTLPNSPQADDDTSTSININSASLLELDQLPGIGKVQSEAIIKGRPYTELDELVRNGVIKQAVYDKIQNQISLY